MVSSFLFSVRRVYLPQRYIFGILGFMAVSNAYIQRFNLSLTITEMTAPVYHEIRDANDCPGTLRHSNSTHKVSIPRYVLICWPSSSI